MVFIATPSREGHGFWRRARKAICYRLAESASRHWKKRFEEAVFDEYLNQPSAVSLGDLHLFSCAGAGQFPLQVLSILSFLRHAGIPAKWIVASDGSLTPAMNETLHRLHPCVEVQPWENFLTDENRAAVEPYAKIYPLGKKLALLTCMPPTGRSIYADSDVLFFEGAFRMSDLLTGPRENYFCADIGNAVMPGVATLAEQQLTPVNSGFLVQMRPLSWMEPLERLHHALVTDPARCESQKHFLEQTVTHLAYHAAGSKRLDRHYALDLSDAFEAEDRFSGPDFVMRHYIVQTRYKFWLHASEYLRK